MSHIYIIGNDPANFIPIKQQYYYGPVFSQDIYTKSTVLEIKQYKLQKRNTQSNIVDFQVSNKEVVFR